MGAKTLSLVAALIMLAAATAIPAGAAQPTVTEVSVDRTFSFPAGTACSFPLTIHNHGIRRTTTFTDTSGNVTRTMIVLIGFTQSYKNDITGATMSTPLAGPAVIEPNGDGTVTTSVPGNDGRLVLPGTGFIYGDVGLIVFTAPDSAPFTQLDVLMLTGHYESPDLYLEAVCSSLA